MPFVQKEYEDPEKVLFCAPGPVPWYSHTLPRLKDFSWEEAGSDELTSGKFCLRNANGEIVVILGMYSYAKAIDEATFVVWYEGYESGYSGAVDLVILDTERLTRVDDLSGTLKTMKERKLYVHHQDQHAVTFRLPTNRSAGEFHVEIPVELKTIEELLILGHSNSPEIRRELGTAGNLCLFVLEPKRDTYQVFPQDWFNNGDPDLGYEWVTRVARDQKSGRIYGEGFRISSFALDSSNREISHTFPYDALFGKR